MYPNRENVRVTMPRRMYRIACIRTLVVLQRRTTYRFLSKLVCLKYWYRNSENHSSFPKTFFLPLQFHVMLTHGRFLAVDEFFYQKCICSVLLLNNKSKKHIPKAFLRNFTLSVNDRNIQDRFGFQLLAEVFSYRKSGKNS